jgi:hypothetical protein
MGAADDNGLYELLHWLGTEKCFTTEHPTATFVEIKNSFGAVQLYWRRIQASLTEGS